MHAQTPIIMENFDAQATGALVAQSIGLPWTTWSNAPGSSEDTPISNEQAFSGDNSMKLSATAVTGGPTDMLLRLGNRTTGVYGLVWKMYVPSGQGAYFNIQHMESPGVQWAVEVTLPPGGSGTIDAVGTQTSFSYPHDQWFDVVFGFDLDNTSAALSMAGAAPYSWPFNTQAGGTAGANQLGAVNFFAYAGGAAACTYYVDDLAFTETTGTGVDLTDMLPALSVFPSPASDVVIIEAAVGHEALVALLDLSGRQVLPARSFDQYGDVARARLDIQALPAGTYILQVLHAHGRSAQRVVKQ